MSDAAEQAATRLARRGDPRLDQTLRLTEVYKSVQGESTWAGHPCVFVRLARCHIRCVWCDTGYAFYGGEKVAIREILDRCDALGCRLVEITGGEPLVQAACTDLAECLLERGFTVLVETSGTLPIRVLPARAVKIMDFKCPGSGECGKNDWSNVDALSSRDEVKFVIAGRVDYEWAREITLQHGLAEKCAAVIFSPAFGFVEPKTLVEWILEDGLDVRFQIQMHKYVWPPDARGV